MEPSENTKTRLERIELKSFPDQPRSGFTPPATIANVEYMLKAGGFSCRYDVIGKRHTFRLGDGRQATINDIVSFANLNGINPGHVVEFAYEIAERNPENPVASWIRSRSWDQVDRLEELYATVVVEEGYPEWLKKQLLYRWLLSAVAAVLTECGFKAAGVLTLQGGQGIGKTSWGRALVPQKAMPQEVFKDDLHIDPGNKDSVFSAISNWIAEFGELDSSFRKDVARLKGFLTSDIDRIRLPYARATRDYPRRTVFIATVNDPNFLVDTTGNRRFWVLPVEKLNFAHGIDMQQLFAQLAADFATGAQWWLTPDEEKALAEENKKYRAVSVIAERVYDFVDAERRGDPGGKQMTPIDVLRAIEITNPTNAQCRECGTVLRELLGPPKRINGRDRWRVHRRTGPVITDIDDDDIY